MGFARDFLSSDEEGSWVFEKKRIQKKFFFVEIDT